MLSALVPEQKLSADFFSKGRPIFIEGRLKLDQWESKEGEKRSAIRVVLDNFEFVDSGKSDGSSSPNDSISQPTRAPDALESSVSPPKEDSPPTDPDLDEDVPF